MDKLTIFDTTLRDGEQAPGASLNSKEKMEVAEMLAAMGVDIIEAGFPISSPGDFESVRDIARSVKGPVICGLARCMQKDIDAAAKAVKPAGRSRVHVFLATSKVHMQFKLKKAEDEILRLAVWAVKYARKYNDNVEFSPEDASRTEKDFLYKVVEAVIKAGAGTVNIPDTVGYAQPIEFGKLIKGIRDNVPNINKAVISVHCHDDLGLAVANSLEAVRNGARQIECTVNGLGERAGNASMEEIVMAVATRPDIYGGVSTDIRKDKIYPVSRLVSLLTGFVIAPNKAVVGGNAFRHESGIHQDGVLKERSTYEIIDPAVIGFKVEGIVLGKHSGRHAFNERLKTLGYSLTEDELNKAFERFKELADKKKDIFDEDLRAIVDEEIKGAEPVWKLAGFEVYSGSGLKPGAVVTLKKRNKAIKGNSEGDGPVDACFKAIDKLTGKKVKLEDFRLEAVTAGKDAMGHASLKLTRDGNTRAGAGSSTDIIEAAIKAYLDALNKLEAATPKKELADL
ncbi:MAG: 2-isopropylmalate synthase [Deltaproteobacteria bacterium]